ncbi:hypothetical protein WT21_01985 [Burkholderia territorii]|uniref:hypothetical protein n=1 Tax=Burkholderia territorii TaxID=1503055 RepID=UPI000751E777|nr:hypothetical protein [Burkholderia territorii]KUZ43978.1 hypothetical protein WS52_01405 [Burkholderia territorii]KUZ51624.1 hypothetical protein WS53_18260 [Burkholderia territorii]KVQ55108.1 hypothetical protein WT21_01985 [Burkholderia territorii]KVT87988.1 hypothetical protein WT25_07895 [Burkholderia territorii]KWA00167.1 hypothetical protein WT36_25715 [Burkholderia territorii]
MFFQSFAARLKRLVHVASDRSPASLLAPLANAFGHRRGSALAHLPAALRVLDCVLIGAMATAVALVALLCVAASRLGFAHVWRIGGWLP